MEQDKQHYLGIPFTWSDWDDFAVQQDRYNMEETLYDILHTNESHAAYLHTVAREYMKKLEQDQIKENKMNAPQPKKFWMITGSGNMPKIRHTDMQAAQAEATRLARANPGTEFFALEATEVFHQPLGVVRNRL